MSSKIINDDLFKKVIEESDEEEEDEEEEDEDETSKINSSDEDDEDEGEEETSILWLLFTVCLVLCCLLITTLIFAGIGVGIWKGLEAGKEDDCNRNLHAIADKTYNWLLKIATLNHTQGQTEVPVYFPGNPQCRELYKSDFELVRII